MPKHWFKARTCLNERPCWAVKSPTPLNTYSSTVSVHNDSRKQQGRTPTGQNWQFTLGRLNGNTCCSNPSLAFDVCRLQTSYHGPWEMTQWIKCWLWKSEDLSLDHQDPCKKKLSVTVCECFSRASRSGQEDHGVSLTNNLTNQLAPGSKREPVPQHKVESERERYLTLTFGLHACLYR